MAEATTIIYPTDFSEASLAAIPWVKRMASMLDADLSCVFVVEDPRIIGPMYGGAIAMPTGQELAQAVQPKIEDFAKDHFGGLNGKVSASVLIGRPAEQIVEHADSVNAAMIIMSTHGYSGVKHMVLGSTAEAVLRHAKCPVLSVHANQ